MRGKTPGDDGSAAVTSAAAQGGRGTVTSSALLAECRSLEAEGEYWGIRRGAALCAGKVNVTCASCEKTK
jgi:hypothetical protein